MAILLSVVFGLLFYPIHVAGLTLCDTDGTLEVVETTASNVFTCTGADSTDVITWILQRSNGNITLATCTPGSCNNPYKPRFKASRPAGDQSTLTVNGSTTSYLQYIQGQTIVCRANRGPASQARPQQTQCTVDIVAVPSVTCDAHYNTGTSSPWTVTANCSVSGAYSYLNRYTCHLTQTSPTTKSLGSGNLVVTSTSGSGGKYKTGYCQVTVPYPDVTGIYSYKMAVTPGRQDVPVSFGGQSSFEIKHPSTPPSHNCPQYVGESRGTSCTCTATDLGQPAGVVRWTSTMTNQLSLSNVSRNDNGTTYRCEVIWNGLRTQSVTYTLQVPYGPSSVSITHPPFPYDTNGQQLLTLTCSASDVNPAPTFTWGKGSANNVVGQGRTYTFRPQPPGDDNSVFVCRAVNSVTGTSRQDNTTLTLNYPPTRNPAITITSTPSNSGSHLHQGDRVTLTCAVTGGKPFGATTVTFTCPGKQDSPDIVESSGVTSTLTFDSLTAADHDKVCTCTTRWRNTNWFNKNESSKLFVSSPPSTPAITKPDNDYPPIATVTQSATLTCHSTNPGVPISTYTWPITQGGRQGTDGQGRGTLTFDTISKELDGKTVRCRARNRFTDNRRPHTVPDGNFTLEVYYKPEISTEPVEDTDPNQCEITSSDKSQCLVTEGQRVHFRCSASSNPQPADITWQGRSKNNPDLLIESAKRADSVTYNCSVTTGRGNHGNDQRLPLKGFSLFTVLVKYPPFISSFEVNFSPASVQTVNASDLLNLSCRTVGRPPPDTKLIHPNKTLIARTPQGSPSVADTPSGVSGKLTARCRDTGIYTCTADNTVGSAQQQTVSIFVQCKPEARNDAGYGSISPVKYRTDAVQLNFSVTAYPIPKLKQVKFFKQKPDGTAVGQAAEEGTVDVKCFPDSNVSADVTCQLTVDDVKPEYAGFYQAFVGNDFGHLILEFEVRVNATDIETVFPVGAVVGAIVTVLVLSAIIVVVVLVIRRRRERKDNPAPESSPRTRDREEPGDDFMITNTAYVSAEDAAPLRNLPSTSQASPYENVELHNAKPVIKPKPKPVIKPKPKPVIKPKPKPVIKPKPKPQHGASAAQVATTGDVYATVNKKHGPQSAPEDSCPVYAVVNKKKEESAQLPTATPGAMKEKPTVGKKPAPKKPKEKGKGKKQTRKEDEQALDPGPSTSSDAVYGNVATLTMRSPEPEGSVYENFGFQRDDSAEKDQKPEPQGSRTVNPDGLVYITIGFSEEQRKKANDPPPERDATTYAEINYSKV